VQHDCNTMRGNKRAIDFKDSDFVRSDTHIFPADATIAALSRLPIEGTPLGSTGHRRLVNHVTKLSNGNVPSSVSSGFVQSGTRIHWAETRRRDRDSRRVELEDVPFAGSQRPILAPRPYVAKDGLRRGYMDVELVFWGPRRNSEQASSAIPPPRGIVIPPDILEIVPISRGDIGPVPSTLVTEFRRSGGRANDGRYFLGFEKIRDLLSNRDCSDASASASSRGECVRDPLWRTIIQRYQSGAIAVSMREVRPDSSQLSSSSRIIDVGRDAVIGYMDPRTRLFAPDVSDHRPSPPASIPYDYGECLYGVWLSLFSTAIEKRKRSAAEMLSSLGACDRRSVGSRPTTLNRFMQSVLRPLRQKCIAISIAGTVLWSYDPQVDRTVHRPMSPFYVVVHDNHAFPMDMHSVKSFQQRAVRPQRPERFRSRKDTRETYITSSMADIETFVARSLSESNDAQQPAGRMLWMGSDSLEDIIHALIKPGHMVPLLPAIDCVSNGARISRIHIGPNHVVEHACSRGCDRLLGFTSAENVRVFDKHFRDLKTTTMPDEYRSWYSKDMSMVVRCHNRHALYTRIPPMISEVTSIVAVDMRRFYASILRSLPFVPVFSVFDKFDGTESITQRVEPSSLYVVRVTDSGMQQFPIYFDRREVIVYGYTLMAYPPETYQVRLVLNPMETHTGTAERIDKAIRRIEACAMLTDEQKKAIPNVVSGLLEKRYTVKERSYPCTSVSWADYLARHLNSSSDGADLGGSSKWTVKRSSHSDDLWMVHRRDRQEKTSGFFPIKLLVYDIARDRMQRLARALSERFTSVPIGIRTDCLYLAHGDDSLHSIGDNATQIAGFAVSVKLTENIANVKFPDTVSVHVESAFPFRESSIDTLMPGRHTHMLVRGGPGTGKSTWVRDCLVRECMDKKSTTIVICPTRALVSEWLRHGFAAMTVNRFFGFRFREWERIRQRSMIKDYDTLVIDELYQLRARTLQMITRLMTSRQELRVIGIGDPDQLPPIEIASKDFREMAISEIFRGALCIDLKDSKRLLHEDDRVWFNAFRMCLDTSRMLDMLRTRCVSIESDDVQSWTEVDTACTYFQCTAMRVAERRMCILPDPGSVWVSRIHSSPDPVTVLSRESGIVTLSDQRSIPIQKFLRCFSSFRARTAYTLQGSTIDTVFAICDLESPHITREWLLTAVSRVRRLDDIRLAFSECAFGDVMSRIRRSRSSMIAQDRSRSNYETDVDIIPSVQELHAILKSTGFRCTYCSVTIDETFEFDRVLSREGGIPMGHTAGNLVPCCHVCNIEKRDS
jgi:AAA domain